MSDLPLITLGFTIVAEGLIDAEIHRLSVTDAERFLRVLYDAILDQLAASDVKTTNA